MKTRRHWIETTGLAWIVGLGLGLGFCGCSDEVAPQPDPGPGNLTPGMEKMKDEMFKAYQTKSIGKNAPGNK
jgi:hypothetical protein